MKSITSAMVLTLLTSLTGAKAFAHSEETHAKKSAMVKKEQKEWGIAGDEKNVTRTVTLNMSDAMLFTPNKIDAKQGETIKIVMKNTGAVLHEMVIGTKKELDAHAALMMKFPNMEHDEPYMAHVPAGKTGKIVWQFNKAGNFDFACLIAGHYQAGMVGKIIVAGK
jgi:uncharacterized cupredoxin-like copper-binding protein